MEDGGQTKNNVCTYQQLIQNFSFKLSTKVHNPPFTVNSFTDLLDHCFDFFADFEEENYYLAETARRDSWVEAESVERRCSASRWAVESSNTLLWKVILSKNTQSPDKKPRRNTSWTKTYKNFIFFWAQHLFCEIANTIFKAGKSEDSFVIISSLREQLTRYCQWYSSHWKYPPPWEHRGQLALRSWDAAVSRDLSAVFTITALGGDIVVVVVVERYSRYFDHTRVFKGIIKLTG